MSSPELIYKILTLLNFIDLCNVSAVSRTMRLLSNDPTLWKNLYIQKYIFLFILFLFFFIIIINIHYINLIISLLFIIFIFHLCFSRQNLFNNFIDGLNVLDIKMIYISIGNFYIGKILIDKATTYLWKYPDQHGFMTNQHQIVIYVVYNLQFSQEDIIVEDVVKLFVIVVVLIELLWNLYCILIL